MYKKQLSEACPKLDKQLFEAQEVEEVFYILQTYSSWPTPPPVIAGSLYLIGDLLNKDAIKN